MGDGGGDVAGEDEGDVDAGVVEFRFEGVEVALDGVFACGVGGAHGGGHVAGNATDDADGALAAREHMREEGACELDGRKEVDVHDFTRGAFGGFEGGGALGDAGVIEEDIDVSFPCDGVFHGLCACVCVDDIEGEDERAVRPDFFGHVCERFFASCAQDDVGAFVREGFGGCPSDAGACAGDPDHLVLKSLPAHFCLRRL